MIDHVHNVMAIVNTMGYEILNPDWYEHIYEWFGWYQGKVSDFHEYKMYNGHKYIDKERYSLGMPKVMAEDWATLLYNDRTCIKVGESDQSDFEEILKKNRFESRFSKFIELYMALGSGAAVEYDRSTHEPRINFIPAPMCFVLKTEDGEPVDCVFASVNDNEYYVNAHIRQKNGQYKITNRYWRFNTSGKPVEQENNRTKREYTSPVKLFQFFRPAIVNNVDIFTPFGISFFGNSIDRIKNVDLIYDSMRNEFQLGKKRLFIRGDLIDYKPVMDEKGNSTNVPIFDDNDTEFYAIPDDESNGEQIKEVNSALRVTEHIGALQSALNMLSDGCGLGNDRYNFQEGRVYTNTSQVISTQSKLYKTLLKHEKELRDGIVEMVKALMYISKGTEYTEDITVDFDDSIIEDSEALQRRALLELQSNLIDPIEYFVQVYKYTEDQAKDFWEKIKDRNPQPEAEPEPE